MRSAALIPLLILIALYNRIGLKLVHLMGAGTERGRKWPVAAQSVGQYAGIFDQYSNFGVWDKAPFKDLYQHILYDFYSSWMMYCFLTDLFIYVVCHSYHTECTNDGILETFRYIHAMIKGSLVKGISHWKHQGITQDGNDYHCTIISKYAIHFTV